MENIRLFKTQEEYLKDKASLPYPSVSFIEETQSVEYYDLPFITANYVIDKYTIDYCKNNGIEEFVLYSNSVGSVKEYRLNGQTYSFDENAYEIVEKKITHERDDFFSPTQDSFVEIKPNQKLTFSTNSDVTLDDYIYIVGYIKDYDQPQHLSCQIKDVFYDNESVIIMSKDLKSCSLSSSFLNMLETVTLSYIDNNSVIIHEDGLMDFLNPNYETIITNNIFLETNDTFNGVITVPLPEKEKNYELKILLNEGITSIGKYTNYYNNSFNFLFYYGSPLTEIDLTELDKNYSYEIPYESFAFSRLKTIKIPQNIVYINNVVLECCNHLTSINVDKNNPYYDSRENCNAIIHTHSNTLICGCKTTIIPENIVNIGWAAFYGCSGFTDIVIPDSVVEIESNAFEGCSLTSVTFGKSLEYIGLRAFCCPLKKVTFTSYEIPEFVNKYEGKLSPYAGTWQPYDNNTFYSIDSDGILYYPFQNEGYAYKDLYDFNYNGWMIETIDVNLTPNLIVTYNVTDINNPTKLFTRNTTVRMLIDGQKVETKRNYLFDSLGEHIVEYCYNDKALPSWGSNNDGIFSTNKNLVSIIVTNFTTKLYKSFDKCPNLTSVTIGDSVTYIEPKQFYECHNLKTIIVNEGNQTYDSRDACNAIIKTETNELFVGCGNTIIPDSVTSIMDRAFQSCISLTSIVIPDSVTSIGDRAFQSCIFQRDKFINNSSLVSDNNWGATLYDIVLNNGLCINGTEAVNCRTNATEVVIPDFVTSIGSSAFTSHNNLTEIVIPDSVTSIGNYAFYDCRSLTSVRIGDSVISIGEQAFRHCSSLSSINIPSSVTSFGYSLFDYCDSLPVIDNIRYADTYLIEPINKTLNKYTIKEGTIFIGEDAFSGCTHLISIEIPDSVTSIGGWAFSNCSALTNVYITSLESWFEIEFGTATSNPLRYAKQLYLNGKLVTDLVIPESVERTKNYVFSYYNSLLSLTIHKNVKEISNYSFYGYNNLKNIIIDVDNEVYDSRENCNAIIETSTNTLISSCKNTIIPNSVTSIGEAAFYNCDSLTSITIPDSVTSIGKDAFYNCDSLTSITISSGVTSIDGNAFSACTSLTNVYITSLESWCNVSFVNGSSNPMYCAKNLYLNGVLVTDLVIPDSVSSIGAHAFRYCSNLTSVTIPNSVTSIGSYAFSNCSGLTSIACNAVIAPTIVSDTFRNITSNGVLKYPQGSDYSSWMKTNSYYLGYYNWTSQEIEVPTEETTE